MEQKVFNERFQIKAPTVPHIPGHKTKTKTDKCMSLASRQFSKSIGQETVIGIFKHQIFSNCYFSEINGLRPKSEWLKRTLIKQITVLK